MSRSLVDADCILGNQVGQVSLHNTGGQYIDLLHPVQCSGDLIAWHFCYYSEDIQDDDTYIVYFRVWRPADANNFNRVHEHTQEMDLDESDSNEFVCMDVPLDPDNYFEVVENDRLGAYVKRTNINGRPLHIISSGTTGLGLFRDTRGGGFDFTPFTSEVVATSDLEEMTDLGLHLYADIGKGIYCSLFSTMFFFFFSQTSEFKTRSTQSAEGAKEHATCASPKISDIETQTHSSNDFHTYSEGGSSFKQRQQRKSV